MNLLEILCLVWGYIKEKLEKISTPMSVFYIKVALELEGGDLMKLQTLA